jgi:hypothetical protein
VASPSADDRGERPLLDRVELEASFDTVIDDFADAERS